MVDVGAMIKQKRLEKGMTLEELGNKVGVGKSTVRKWENGMIQNMRRDKIEKLATALGISPLDILGKPALNQPVDISHSEKIARTFTIPVLGRVAAGIPIEAVEDIVDYEELSSDIFRDSPKSYFGLQIKGNSMEPRICDGDYVIVHGQDDAECDDIVIALVNGNDAVCKRLKKYADSIALVSLNPAYEPMIFTKEQIDSLPVRIIGKVVELRGKL